MIQGKLFIFSAPSGAGKTTIVKQLLAQNDYLEFSVSATSRNIREGEINQKDYYFLSAEEFKAKINNNEFLEWEEVYENQFYGTLKSELDRIWSKGHHVVFDVDVVGGLNIKQSYPENALAVFVMPPSIEILKERLVNRSTENDDSLRKRLDKADYELSFANKFDIILVNDELKHAVSEANRIVNHYINS